MYIISWIVLVNLNLKSDFFPNVTWWNIVVFSGHQLKTQIYIQFIVFWAQHECFLFTCAVRLMVRNCPKSFFYLPLYNNFSIYERLSLNKDSSYLSCLIFSTLLSNLQQTVRCVVGVWPTSSNPTQLNSCLQDHWNVRLHNNLKTSLHTAIFT